MAEKTQAPEKSWKAPLGIVLDVIVRDGKILLLKRKGEVFRGLWGFPGGKIEFGEGLKEAALREALEETGVECEFVALRGVASEIVKPENPDAPEQDKHFLLFICSLKPKSLATSHSVEGEIEWFDLDKLPEKMVPSDKLLVTEFTGESKHVVPSHSIFLRQSGQDYFIESFHG
ncbi:TPA: NUDIX domain-containing protein [Candidatus Micrarchaeota archaeon]|nr:NUDIX domain-containing protein [Candidatus Micrarchaeota archaeon]